MPTLKADRITGADVAMADELVLCLVNDEPTYRRITFLRTSLAKKVKRGVYDPTLAGRAWRYVVEDYIATWKRENGYTGRIDVPTRNLAGRSRTQVPRGGRRVARHRKRGQVNE